jgi:hypothetical protein
MSARRRAAVKIDSFEQDGSACITTQHDGSTCIAIGHGGSTCIAIEARRLGQQGQ